MKKFLTILLIIVLVITLAVAGVAGYFWYQNTHIFINGNPYPLDTASLDLREEYISAQEYEQIQKQLPGCDIVWNVLFREHRISSDTRELNVDGLDAADVEVLRYFPRLEAVNVSGENLDFALLNALKSQRPDLAINYQVSLGGLSVGPDVTELTLEPGEYTQDALIENLKHLSQLTSVTLKKVESLPVELEAAYPDLNFHYTVELLGKEMGTETTALDLSGLSAQEALAVAPKLALLPGLESVELMKPDGTSALSMEDVKALKDAAPSANFHFTFEFYGETISTSDEEVYISNKKIGDEGLPQVRAALDLMGPNCKRFVLENCKISNEELAKLREEYRGRTKVVWRVYFGDGGSCLTDREVIKAVYGLKDSNCMELQYCEDAKFCDFGHNEYLNTCAFVAGMPNLEAIILSGSPIKDLEGFRNCKKLKFLEVAFCGYIKDISPLAECTSLEMLNISATKVGDITPVMELPLTLFSAKNLKLSNDAMKSFENKHPDCWTSFQREGTKVQPYGKGWRYDKNNKYLPYYEMLRDVFGYDHPVNTTKW